jgi:hypothetical protein
VPIERNNNEGRFVLLIDGFDDLSTPDDDFAFIGFRIFKKLLEGERSVCLDS